MAEMAQQDPAEASDLPFVKKSLGTTEGLSPVLQTKAIKELTGEMVRWPSDKIKHSVKPRCVTCFDMSGTGKTTTIEEASRNSNSILCHINLTKNDLFKGLFRSCKTFGKRQNPPKQQSDIVSTEDVEKYMSERFDEVLIVMFNSIIEQCNEVDVADLDRRGADVTPSLPQYVSPNTSPESKTKTIPPHTPKDVYLKLIDVIKSLKHLLVIHLDDCQLFFCGLTKTPEFTDCSIRVQDIMSMALKFFSNWDKIESDAIREYHQQIVTSMKEVKLFPRKMAMYARNLCLLYLHVFTNNASGSLELADFPVQWMPFIEAGFIRIREKGSNLWELHQPPPFGSILWELQQPPHFLVKVFNTYVKWFHWGNVRRLIANITAAEGQLTLKGKVFECLFALELCSAPNSPLWKMLSSEIKIQQKFEWDPSISLMSSVQQATDQNKIYIMIDPDRSKSKTDIIFFAHEVCPGKLLPEVVVRVLCQLTAQTRNCDRKGEDAFEAMRQLQGDISDYRLFLSSDFNCSLTTQPSEERCFWLDSTKLAGAFSFPLDLCDPSLSGKFLVALLDFANSHGDTALAKRISNWNLDDEFDTMDEFYEALREWKCDEEDIEMIKKVCVVQNIKVTALSLLTEADWKEYGIGQGGLRKIILAVLGKLV